MDRRFGFTITGEILRFYWIVGAFLILLIILGRMKGLRSAVSLFFTGTVLIFILVPQLFSGRSAIFTTVYLMSINCCYFFHSHKRLEQKNPGSDSWNNRRNNHCGFYFLLCWKANIFIWYKHDSGRTARLYGPGLWNRYFRTDIRSDFDFFIRGSYGCCDEHSVIYKVKFYSHTNRTFQEKNYLFQG